MLLNFVCISREHLSEEDLRKNKAMLESLTKGQLVDNPEVMCNVMFRSSMLAVDRNSLSVIC